MKDLFEGLSGITMVLCYGPYCIGMFAKDKNKRNTPCRVTWFLFCLLDWLMLVALINKNEWNWQIIGGTFGSSVTFILSLWKGKGGRSMLDIICLTISLTALGYWMIHQDHSNLLIVSGIVALVAAWPTYVSAWKDPTEENRWGWLIGFISCLLYLPLYPWSGTRDDWWDTKLIQPVVFLILEVILVYLVWVRPYRTHRKQRKRSSPDCSPAP